MLTTLSQFAYLLGREEEGASLVEYVLLVACIAIVCAGSIAAIGQALKPKMDPATLALDR